MSSINFLGYKDIPIAPAGVGGGNGTTRWLYSEYGTLLSALNITTGISYTFNLSSYEDIENKLKSLYHIRDLGRISNDDVSELEERLRTANDLTAYGREKSKAALSEECKPTTSQKQIDHLRKIQPLTHTDEANEKRRKTISAKQDEKILGINEKKTGKSVR